MMVRVRSFKHWLLASLCLVWLTIPVSGQLLFLPENIEQGFTGAHSVYPADLDGDRDIDFIVAGSTNGQIAWWENDTHRHFTRHNITGNFGNIWSICATDIDDDGDIDILGGGTNIILWENDGHRPPSFTEHLITSNPPIKRSITAGDIDDDGDIDILCGGNPDGASRGAISWLDNQGDFTFLENTVNDTFRTPSSVHILDLDQDGDADLLAGSNDSLGVWWWQNDGNETFTAIQITQGVLSTPSIYPADMDEDDDIDIVFARGGTGAARRAVELYINDGNQVFTEFDIAANFPGPSSVFVADLDRDNLVDVIAASTADDNITWWKNWGENFYTIIDIVPGNIDNPKCVVAKDMDSDGDVDLLAAGNGQGEITWWYNYTDPPGNPPATFNLLNPPNNSVIHTRGPTMRWRTAVDPDVFDVIRYTLVWSVVNNTFIVADSVEDIVDTTYTFTEDRLLAQYNELRHRGEIDDLLPDDMRIYWRVRAADRNTNGVWCTPTPGWYFDIDAPNPPDHFNLISPAQASVINEWSVDLSWEPSFDSDGLPGQDLSYHVWWSTTMDFTTGADSASVPGTSHTIVNLLDDHNYWWKVRAQDANTPGTWSNETRLFITDIPNPPLGFNLESPPNGFTFNTDQVRLRWQASIDPDAQPGDQITYHVCWATNEQFTENYGTFQAIGLGYTLLNLLDDHTYWWKVLAQDVNTSGTWSNQIWTFNVFIFNTPMPFSLTSPENEALVSTHEVTLSWNASSDTDAGDIIEYIVRWATNSDFTEHLDSVRISETSYQLTGILDNISYFWRVRAQDTNTNGTWSNEIWSFNVAIPEPPGPFSLSSPTNHGQYNLRTDFLPPFEVPFGWYRSTDPDPGEVVTYKLTITGQLESGGTPVTVSYSNIQTNSYRVHIPRALGFPITTTNLRVNWTVHGISGIDTVECITPFDFILFPYNKVDENIYEGIPTEYSIVSTYPNPFNPSMMAVIGLPETSILTVRVYNLMGEEITILAKGKYSAGYQRFTFTASGLPSGIYFIRATVPNELDQMEKVMLMK